MLKRYGSKISLLMLAMVVVIMFLEIVTGLNNRGIYEIFLSGMSLAVAAMTEFYIAFGYIVVACGLFPSSMGKNRRQGGVILKNISKLEKLRDIDCVIFKKDGVLTELSKQVEAMYANGSLYRTGDYDRANESFAPLVEAAVITTGQYMKSSLAHQGTGSERTAECEAIIDCAKRYSLYNVGLDSRYPLLYHKTSMQSPSYSMSIVDDGKKRYAYIRGSARDMLEHCISLKVAGTHLPINKEVKLDIASVIAEYEKVNAGVYAIAVCEIGRELPNEPYALLRKNELELIGLLMIRARLYDGCALTIERLKSCGIKLVLSASDSAEDIAIAKTLGICTDERDILTERVLSSMTDDSLTETAHAYSLYSGLKNASLRRVMNALKQRGMRVAYSARSLSEISLLDTADIGFSQTELPEKKSSNTKLTREREAGDDALRFRSDVLISQNESGAKSGIDAIERSILTAKLIYKNVMNMFAYLAEVQFARLFIVLYSVFTRSTMLEPMQILVGGLIFDLLAVLAITFSRPSKRTYKEYEQAANELADLPHFILRNALFGVFWAAMTIFVPMILSSFGLVMTDTMLSSTVFITFTILQPLVLAEAKRSDSIIDISSVSYNPVYVMMCICAATIIAVGILVPKFGAVIGVTLPSVASLISMLVTVACVLMLHEAYKLIAKNAK